jgi:hypothetical protein
LSPEHETVDGQLPAPEHRSSAVPRPSMPAAQELGPVHPMLQSEGEPMHVTPVLHAAAPAHDTSH